MKFEEKILRQCEKIKDKPIREIFPEEMTKIDARCYHALLRGSNWNFRLPEFETVEDVLLCPEKDLLRIRCLGTKSLDNLRQRLIELAINAK